MYTSLSYTMCTVVVQPLDYTSPSLGAPTYTHTYDHRSTCRPCMWAIAYTHQTLHILYIRNKLESASHSTGVLHSSGGSTRTEQRSVTFEKICGTQATTKTNRDCASSTTCTVVTLSTLMGRCIENLVLKGILKWVLQISIEKRH